MSKVEKKLKEVVKMKKMLEMLLSDIIKKIEEMKDEDYSKFVQQVFGTSIEKKDLVKKIQDGEVDVEKLKEVENYFSSQTANVEEQPQQAQEKVRFVRKNIRRKERKIERAILKVGEGLDRHERAFKVLAEALDEHEEAFDKIVQLLDAIKNEIDKIRIQQAAKQTQQAKPPSTGEKPEVKATNTQQPETPKTEMLRDAIRKFVLKR